MTVEQAEKLVCPFLMNTGYGYMHCITTNCMAWFVTKDCSNVHPYENLPSQECEGYCMKLYQEN